MESRTHIPRAGKRLHGADKAPDTHHIRRQHSAEPSEIFNVNVRRISYAWAKIFVEEINKHGGDARLLHLPKIGIKGNTHAPFADLNNLEIADVVEKYLHEKGLYEKTHPHKGHAPKGLKEYTIPLEAE